MRRARRCWRRRRRLPHELADARLPRREAVAARRRRATVPPARSAPSLDLPRPIFLTVGRLAVEKNLEAFLKLDLPGTKLVVGDGPARAALARHYPDAVFLGAQAGRGTGRDLCRRRCVRVPEPHRHLRPGAAGGAGERRAGRGLSGGGAARRDRRGAGRRARRGFAARLSRRAGMLARGLPRLRARHDLGGQRAHFPRACVGRRAGGGAARRARKPPAAESRLDARPCRGAAPRR